MAWIIAFLPSITVTLLLLLAEARATGGGDWGRNVQAWGVQLALGMLLLPLIANSDRFSLIEGRQLPFWAAFTLFLLVKDLGEYAYHRAQHAVPMLWAMHSLHHSDPDMGVLTTQRHFWGDQIVKQLTIWPAAMLVIAPTPAVIGIYGLVSLWNLLTHSRLRLSFGRGSWLINSPAYHRRHHSALPEHYNSNFAALLPIFDVICGSYRRPDGFPPTGLDKAPASIAELLIWPLIWNRPRQSPASQGLAPSTSP